MLKRMLRDLRDRLMAQQQLRSPEIPNPESSPPKEAAKNEDKNEAPKENAAPKS